MQRRSIKADAGYNLIQMAIALIVLGLLIAPFANLYYLKTVHDRDALTRSNLSAIMQVIQNYKTDFGVYPCPAPLVIDRDATAYGKEVNSSDPLKCRGSAITSIPMGQCGTGDKSVCVEKSVRTPALANPRVIVGMVPFRLLQLNESAVTDGYGSRFIYAMTESLADPLTFNEQSSAGIDIRDPSGQTLLPQAGSASFVILSPGKDMVGAYNRNGKNLASCAGAGFDVTNCNPGFATAGSGKINSIYYAGLENDKAGATHFDDLVDYFTQDMDPLWRRTQADTENVQQVLTAGRVGVGIGNTQATTRLEVSSKFTADPGSDNRIDAVGAYGTDGSDGKIIASSICDENGANCFTPSVIGGKNKNNGGTEGMTCPAGQFMFSVNGGTPKCTDKMAFFCPSDKPRLVGKEVVGGVTVFKCAAVPPPACGADTKQACALTSTSFAASVAGTQLSAASNVTLANGDQNCRTDTYTCGGAGGTTTLGAWTLTGSTGSCNFKPVTTTGLKCDFGSDQTYSSTSQCNGSAITTKSACRCNVGGTQSGTVTCKSVLGSNYTGNITVTTTYTPYTPPQATCKVTTNQDTSGCKCVAKNPRSISAGSCPSGYTGSITQPQIWDTTSCGWVNNGPVVNTCKCNTTATVTYQDAVCSGSSCQVPNPNDRDAFTTYIDAATCKAKTPVQTHTGSCMTRTFSWVRTGSAVSSGVQPSGTVIHVNDSCSCSDFSGNAKFCYQAGDSSYQKYTCKCQ